MKKEKAYAYIKRLIMDGKWDVEEPINVNEITEHLQMSRTPIHKALTQLQQEGFLTIIPQVGVFVKKPKKSEVMERILVCSNLDVLLAEQAVPRISEETIHDLEELLIKMDCSELSTQDYSILNIEFHSVIYAASELTYTMELTRQIWDYLQYIGNPDILFSSEKRKRSQREHWMIYQAIKDRDSHLAKILMEKHVRRISESVEESFRSE
ncbi:GntR family transcriptional regulator [Niallia sp. Krafla_26]|uniref:GntR family transcriptional regulator n=1 Tax=Niallia sp. Krafla_26 TaxID=3064703 RepID=UPI003D184817